VPTAVWSAEGCAQPDYAQPQFLQASAHWPFPAAWRLNSQENLGGERAMNDPGAFTSRTSG